MQEKFKKISKYFSFILRHNPRSINLEMDDLGWVSIESLIKNTTQFSLSFDIIKQIVSEQHRFKISPDRTKIKANQGHSIDIVLDLKPSKPPKFLLHGTAERFVKNIMNSGLNKQKRNFVHLTSSFKVAEFVGSRHGKSSVLTVESGLMYSIGYNFFKTENNIWLIKYVPANHVKILV